MNNIKNNESGIISILGVFVLLFLLVFSVSTFTYINNNKASLQEQKYDYDTIFNKKPNIISAKNTEIIEIYNADQFNIVGSGANYKKNNIIYSYGIGMSYVLKDNIIVDIDEEVKESKYDFFDYKLYSKNYHIDSNDKDIYYYKDGKYYKTLIYQKFGDNSSNNIALSNYTLKEKDNFSSLDILKKSNNEVELLLIYKDKATLQYNEAKETIKQNRIASLNSIDIFNKSRQDILNNSVDYYIFISIENSI